MTLGSHCNERQEIRLSKTRAEIKTLHKNSKRLFKSQLSSVLIPSHCNFVCTLQARL